MSAPTCICASALSFTAVGLIVGAFAIGGLIYSLSVRRLVGGSARSASPPAAASMLALAFLTLAFAPHGYFAPFAVAGIGLGFYMLHNTLQTNATQMTPEARGTAVGCSPRRSILGQTVGVAIAAPMFDRFSAVPVFVISAPACSCSACGSRCAAGKDALRGCKLVRLALSVIAGLDPAIHEHFQECCRRLCYCAVIMDAPGQAGADTTIESPGLVKADRARRARSRRARCARPFPAGCRRATT